MRDRLLERVRPHVDDVAWRWIEQAMRDASTATVDELCSTYTHIATRLGTTALSRGEADLPDSRQPAIQPIVDHWTVADAGRAALLLTLAEKSPDPNAFVSTAIVCYERGDSTEQRSWLKSTAVLPLPDRFLRTVIDACRTNILPLFEAVACENPYPAQHFPERNFNQLVLKALFNNVALSRIVSLASRLNPELARMAGDYADERRAAGRTVPADIGLAMQNRVTEEQPR